MDKMKGEALTWLEKEQPQDWGARHHVVNVVEILVGQRE
jgi:hypothetical protein